VLRAGVVVKVNTIKQPGCASVALIYQTVNTESVRAFGFLQSVTSSFSQTKKKTTRSGEHM